MHLHFYMSIKYTLVENNHSCYSKETAEFVNIFLPDEFYENLTRQTDNGFDMIMCKCR